MLPEFAEVARQVRIPLATGERLTTKAEFGTLLRLGGVKILQPALGRVGGIWEAKKIAAMAEVFNAEMAPHLYAGPVEWAANIHLAASIPNLLMAETIQTGGAFHLALIRHSITWEDGYILPPEAPGLASTSTRIWPAPIPITGHGCIWRCRKRPATIAMATGSKAARRARAEPRSAPIGRESHRGEQTGPRAGPVQPQPTLEQVGDLGGDGQPKPIPFACPLARWGTGRCEPRRAPSAACIWAADMPGPLSSTSSTCWPSRSTTRTVTMAPARHG